MTRMSAGRGRPRVGQVVVIHHGDTLIAARIADLWLKPWVHERMATLLLLSSTGWPIMRPVNELRLAPWGVAARWRR